MIKLYLIALMGLCATTAENEVDSIRKGNTQFAYDISRLMTESYQNALFSPISAHTVLSMLYQGAGGSTKEALAAALHVPDPVQTAQAYEAILKDLNSDNAQIDFSIANKIYVKPGDTLKPKFTSMVKNHFSSEVQTLDFARNDEAAKEINLWVESQTNNKIHDLLQAEDLGVDTHMVLVNAFHFKGKWHDTFYKEDTRNGEFNVNETTTVQVQMMTVYGDFIYEGNTEYGADIIRLPFQNTNYSMLVVLPHEKYDVNHLIRKLSEDGSTLGKGGSSTFMAITMPKFKLSTKSDMEESLTKLGLSELFSPSECDLTNMFTGGEDVYISKAIQKTYISVDESGCEASGSTGMVTASRNLFEMKVTVDHPFLFTIGHSNPSGATDILLIGRIVDPTVTDI